MKRKPTKKLQRSKTNKQLDWETSALVLAEYLTLDKVETREINAILDDVPHGLSNREIAITFRIADTLGVPDAFRMAPRLSVVFAALRAGLAQTERAA